jgi:DhnA family fructose-bisphosphate aldolase class Ia
VILALDHAPLGLLDGLDRAEEILFETNNMPLNGAIINYGVLKRLRDADARSDLPLICRLDGNRTFLSGDWTKSAEWELLYSADACKRTGASGAVVNLLLGGPAEMASIEVVARAAVTCRDVSLPLLVSAMYVGEERIGDEHAFAARMAYELGADAVCAYDVRDPKSLSSVMRWCPVPVYAQGAPDEGGHAGLARWAAGCVAAGARGVVVGRPVWQNPDPIGSLRALLSAIAHES